MRSTRLVISEAARDRIQRGSGTEDQIATGWARVFGLSGSGDAMTSSGSTANLVGESDGRLFLP